MRRALRVVPATSPGDASGLVGVGLDGGQTRIRQRPGADHGLAARRIDEATPAVFDTLPAAADVPMPPAEQFSEVLAALDRYRETSPQMVVLGALIRDALPV